MDRSLSSTSVDNALDSLIFKAAGFRRYHDSNVIAMLERAPLRLLLSIVASKFPLRCEEAQELA